jgi:hypothetical protein
MNLKSERKAHIVSLLFLAVFCILAAGSMGTPAPTGTNASPASDYKQSSLRTSESAQSVIRISAENLLAEFQRSEADKEARAKSESLSTYLNDNTETAEARYKGKRIELTGIVTGVFIPSLETSRRILESRGKGVFDEQGGAGSFITMGGPYPHSAEETLLLPGITAWSKTGDSLQPTFGKQNIESLSGRLVVGKQASLLCSFSSSSGSSPSDLSISLEDCILEPSSPAPVVSSTGAPGPSAEREQTTATDTSMVADADGVVHIPADVLITNHPRMKLLCAIAEQCSNVHVTAELIDNPRAASEIRGYTIITIKSGLEYTGNNSHSDADYAAEAKADPAGAKLAFHEGSAKYKSNSDGTYTVAYELYDPDPPPSATAHAASLQEARRLAMDAAIASYISDVCMDKQASTSAYCNETMATKP